MWLQWIREEPVWRTNQRTVVSLCVWNPKRGLCLVIQACWVVQPERGLLLSFVMKPKRGLGYPRVMKPQGGLCYPGMLCCKNQKGDSCYPFLSWNPKEDSLSYRYIMKPKGAFAVLLFHETQKRTLLYVDLLFHETRKRTLVILSFTKPNSLVTRTPWNPKDCVVPSFMKLKIEDSVILHEIYTRKQKKLIELVNKHTTVHVVFCILRL